MTPTRVGTDLAFPLARIIMMIIMIKVIVCDRERMMVMVMMIVIIIVVFMHSYLIDYLPYTYFSYKFGSFSKLQSYCAVEFLP